MAEARPQAAAGEEQRPLWPARAGAAPQEEPSSTAFSPPTAAAPRTPLFPPADEEGGWRGRRAEARPPRAEPSSAAPGSAHPADDPGAPAAAGSDFALPLASPRFEPALDSHPGLFRDRPEAGGAGGAGPASGDDSSPLHGSAPEPLAARAELADLEAGAEAAHAAADSDDGEAESEEREEDGRTEVKKKRSRRGRGGRRKNGRPAALEPAAAGEEDDEPLHEEPRERPVPTREGPTPLAPARAARENRDVREGRDRDAREGREVRELREGRELRSGSESYVIPAGDFDSMSREIIISVPDRQRPQHEERKIAVFCDFENIALGVRDSEISKFDIGLILERLLEKGKIIVKKAYADWERYSDYKRPFHEAAIELIDIPQKYYSGKNSADIKMVVDAMDLSYSKEHLDTFVILSGDSDFSPLVSKLKENNKYVIGIGVKNSSSNLLVDNCDEFIYYEDVWRDAQKGPKLDGLNKKTTEAFSLMVESIQALLRENKDVLWGSMIKQTMQRKRPSFNEGYYGYSTFSELLEDAERKNIIKLKKDQRSGTYIVTGFAKTGDAMTSGRRQP
ncbi:MAG TPA: NYN domain-containing protein [Thermoanaerobaculia bacterium]|nr:NYN domain-containing protein [Thermoanaerobaculia bacterium]